MAMLVLWIISLLVFPGISMTETRAKGQLIHVVVSGILIGRRCNGDPYCHLNIGKGDISNHGDKLEDAISSKFIVCFRNDSGMVTGMADTLRKLTSRKWK